MWAYVVTSSYFWNFEIMMYKAVDWSPEGNPKFTPNERFFELKDVRPRPWVTKSHEHSLTEREATIYAH